MNRKGFSPLIVIGMIAVIVVVGAVGYFVWNSNASVSQSQNPPCCKTTAITTSTTSQNLTAINTTTAVAQSPVGETTTVDTSHWQTYTNQHYGFQMQYPSNWYVINNQDGSINFSDAEARDYTSYFTVSFVKDGNPNLLSTNQLLSQVDEDAAVGNIDDLDATSTLTINGYPAYNFVTDDIIAELHTYILHGADMATVEYEIAGSDGQESPYNPMYEKMLSTFQFTSSSMTSN